METEREFKLHTGEQQEHKEEDRAVVLQEQDVSSDDGEAHFPHQQFPLGTNPQRHMRCSFGDRKTILEGS